MLWLRQFVAIMFFINVGAAPLNLIAKFSYIFVGFPVLTGFMLLFIIYKTFNHPEVMSTEQLRKITQQLEYQKEIEKVRRQISNDIHDELGAGLTQITMLSELEKLKQKSETSATASFEKISTLSNALMLSLREVVWAMNPVHDNLNSLLAFFRQTVSTFFEPTAIRIQLNIAESADTIAIDPFMRRNLVLIVKEALNNIVKHADASVVSFTCEVEQQQLCISIQDNGKGMPETTSVLGNGIRNIEKRVEAIGGTLAIQTTPDHGVTLNIQVPLNRIT
jgi:signal transduction histidine kinase